jgi:hypothetical protein
MSTRTRPTPASTQTSPAPVAAGAAPAAGALSRDSELAGSVKALVIAGERDAARDRFAELVARQQRRALRIAYHYLRDAHDADEASRTPSSRCSRISSAIGASPVRGLVHADSS